MRPDLHLSRCTDAATRAPPPQVFQGYYYFHHSDLDRNRRDKLADSASTGSGVPGPEYKQCSETGPPEGAWQLCVDFCEKWDAPSFCPDYDSLELGSSWVGEPACRTHGRLGGLWQFGAANADCRLTAW